MKVFNLFESRGLLIYSYKSSGLLSDVSKALEIE